MAVKYLAGNRLYGTDAERLAMATAGSPPKTSWKELGRHTWDTGEGNVLDVTDFAEKDNLMVLAHCTTNKNQYFQVGYDGTIAQSDYTFRGHRKYDGENTSGAPTGATSGTWGVKVIDQQASGQNFFVINIRNKASFRKGLHCMAMQGGTNGSGVTQNIVNQDYWGYHYNSTDQIDSVRFHACDSSPTTSGCGDTLQDVDQAIVLGCDDNEADTGTTPFWVELGTATLTSDTAYIEIDDDALKKKWLYMQYFRPDSSNQLEHLTFNGDTNYCQAGWNNSTTFFNSNSRTNILPNGDTNSTGNAYVEAYIYNDTTHEKLFNGYGNRASYINRIVGKYVPSSLSTQISSIRISASSGTLGDGTTLRVWGAD